MDKKITAPAYVIEDQETLRQSILNESFKGDVIFVLKNQGPKANGMPEVHYLMPLLKTLTKRGLKVALITDGRLSGASGDIPAVVHLHPEAIDGGPIDTIKNGDTVCLDATEGSLQRMGLENPANKRQVTDKNTESHSYGRGLFNSLRKNITHAELGATTF